MPLPCSLRKQFQNHQNALLMEITCHVIEINESRYFRYIYPEIIKSNAIDVSMQSTSYALLMLMHTGSITSIINAVIACISEPLLVQL